MGIVNEEPLTDVSQEFAPQLPVASEEDDVVEAALRGSTTRSGTTIFNIGSIVPSASGLAAGIGTRGPSLTIFRTSICSIFALAERAEVK